jgi:uncharacterized lipoprotein YddW (UPF0748 family)
MNFHRRIHALTVLPALFLALTARAATNYYVPAAMEPPGVQREFRAAWIATVGNIDWPSTNNLTVKQQKAEMVAILDRAVRLNLNAVIFQVRPISDALYDSQIEPWSYYLTGTMGQPPSPYYDPLAFAVDEAHKRGLELHAWFNPFRAGPPTGKFPMSKNHISRTHPDLVRKYGNLLWLDPGEKEVQDYSLRVVMDVVKRYDIDGVHFDDYFYPYKQQDAHKRDLDFPDWSSWHKYGESGKLSRDDWRRENVNKFVRRVYESIKSAKPWVKFGISPFGIWQPGYPASARGMNAFNVLYCDSRKWLTNGWLDYCSPQLYWSIDAPEQGFQQLLNWWLEQNIKHRNVWPGLDSERVGGKWKAEEIVNQIKITRERCDGAAGEVQWSMKCLMQDRDGLATKLANGVYAEPALIPASPWLEQYFPAKPKLTVEAGGNLSWKPTSIEKVALWVLQTRFDHRWTTRILPGDMRHENLVNPPEVVALTAIDRCGVASPPVVLQRSGEPAK